MRAGKTLTILLFKGPYASQQAEYACRIAEKAVELGYNVNLFLYGDGVHAAMKGQAPKAFLNIGEYLTKLAKKGVLIKSCERCSRARGYVEGEFDAEKDSYASSKVIDGVKIYGLYGFIEMLSKSDKVLNFS